MNRVLLVIVAATAFACGGGSNKVDGSYPGQSIDVGGAILSNVNDGTNELSIVVLESQDGDVCTYVSTRPLNNTRFATILFDVVGSCGIGTSADATDGSVEVTRAVADASGHVTALAGTFEAVFANGERIARPPGRSLSRRGALTVLGP
jgi:hypothetical protein